MQFLVNRFKQIMRNNEKETNALSKSKKDQFNQKKKIQKQKKNQKKKTK